MSVTETTKRKLLAASGNQCAHPDCSELMFDLDHQTILGKICHIKGSKSRSARYDKNQSDEDRHSFNNLIALCGKHHDLIDDNEERYTVELIRRWKRNHEERVASQRDIGWLGESRTTIFVENGGVQFTVEYWFDSKGNPQVFSPEQKALRTATIDFTILLSGVSEVFGIISQITDTTQIPHLQQKVEKLKLNDEGFVSTVYHLLFEMQDLKVSELAVAQTQGKLSENLETFRKLGEKLLADRIENPKLKHIG
ncbi:MAG: hypothetical protein COB07_13135 [Sulfurovum sp.]|nr:MAG: hypothetical protein COB07_13135 [Sulfurovum sp.]